MGNCTSSWCSLCNHYDTPRALQRAPMCDHGLWPTNRLEFAKIACKDAFLPVLNEIEQSSTPRRAVVIGDSIAASLENATLPNVAVGGDTTWDLEAILPLVQHVGTSEVWMLIGVNDLLQQASAKCVHQRIVALTRQLQPLETHVLTLLPVSEGVDDFCCLYRRISRLNQLLRADERLRVHGCWDAPVWDEKRTHRLMRSDGLHLNEAGKRVLQKQFRALVAEYSVTHGATLDKPTCRGPLSPLPPIPRACAKALPCREAGPNGTLAAPPARPTGTHSWPKSARADLVARAARSARAVLRGGRQKHHAASTTRLQVGLARATSGKPRAHAVSPDLLVRSPGTFG